PGLIAERGAGQLTVRSQRDLTGYEQQIPVLDRLAVRADRGGRLRALDDRTVRIRHLKSFRRVRIEDSTRGTSNRDASAGSDPACWLGILLSPDERAF